MSEPNSPDPNRRSLMASARGTLKTAKKRARRAWKTMAHFKPISLERRHSDDVWMECEADGQTASRPPEHRATLRQAGDDDSTPTAKGVSPLYRAPLATQESDTETSKPQSKSQPPSSSSNSYSNRKPFQPNGIRFVDDNIDSRTQQSPNSELESENSGGGAGGAFRRTNAGGSANVTRPQTLRDRVVQKPGLVFLQFEDETKRTVLPAEPQSLDDVRSLFVRAFPEEVSVQYLQQPHVRIYIQDKDKPDFFYELDDVRDVKDRSVLRVREHNAKTPTPLDNAAQQAVQAQPTAAFEPIAPPPPSQPPSYLDEELQYYSESELEMADYRSRRVPYYPQSQASGAAGVRQRYQHRGGGGASTTAGIYYPNRPASALPPGATGSLNRRYAGFRALQPQQRNSAESLDQKPPLSPSSVPRRIKRTGSDNVDPSSSPFQAVGRSSYMRSPFAGDIAPAYVDENSSLGRSGAATPIIDEEARLRMVSMEKQLANLSSLVHTALSAKSAQGSHPEPQKDLDALRKEILGPPPGSVYHRHTSQDDNASDAGSISRFSDMSSDKASFMSMQSGQGDYYPLPSNNQELRRQLFDVKGQVGDMQAELKHLRRTAQMNAESNKTMLKDTFERIKQLLDASKQQSGDVSTVRSQLELTAPIQSNTQEDEFWRTRLLIDQEAERHKIGMKKIDAALCDLERQIEDIRLQVVNTNRKLRVSEVELLTNQLTAVGRMAAHHKSQYPTLHSHLKAVMSAEMEKVVKEEKFLKEEPAHMDAALRRCKKLTNTMITMKKLALVQDPEGDRRTPVNSPPIPPPPQHYTSPSPLRQSPPRKPIVIESNTRRTSKSPSPIVVNGQPPHILDNLLEELHTVARAPGFDNSATSTPKSANLLVNGKPAYPRALQSNGPVVTGGALLADRGSREGTPSSVSSEPCAKPPIPPPPAKYATLDRKPHAAAANRTMDLMELKHQLSSLNRAPPAAIERTNALDDQSMPQHNGSSETSTPKTGSSNSQLRPTEEQRRSWIRSASSNESMNSQEGRGSSRETGVVYESTSIETPPAKPPPPPPPPRNRQELMEQMDKQRQQYAANGFAR